MWAALLCSGAWQGVWGCGTGAAASQWVTPRGVQLFWRLYGGGGGPPPPWLTQTLGVGRSGGQPPGSPGGVGGYPNIHTAK